MFAAVWNNCSFICIQTYQYAFPNWVVSLPCKAVLTDRLVKRLAANQLSLMTIAKWYHSFPSRTGQ
jgi:hypothetical protein